MSDGLLAWRGRFPTLARGPYFAAHTLGPMPDSVPDALAGFAAEWAEQGVVAWYGWMERLRAVAGQLEALLGAAPGSVALGPNVSVLAGQVLTCLDWAGPRDRLVTTDLEFPTCDYLYRAQETVGAKVELVPSRDLAVDEQRLVEAIDERTALVAVTHVAFRSAALLDVAPVVERAHQVGALVLLDTYQSAGTVPTDLTALGVDLAVGGSVKWLLGGPGTGYLYARPEVAERLAPLWRPLVDWTLYASATRLVGAGGVAATRALLVAAGAGVLAVAASFILYIGREVAR